MDDFIIQKHKNIFLFVKNPIVRKVKNGATRQQQGFLTYSYLRPRHCLPKEFLFSDKNICLTSEFTAAGPCGIFTQLPFSVTTYSLEMHYIT